MAINTYLTDSRDWLRERESNSIHAVVTDPPYGPSEYAPQQLAKLRSGKGGVWRVPPEGRRPLPRFTELKLTELEDMIQFFLGLARELQRVLVPGAHVFLATNPLLSTQVYAAFIRAGFEPRGEIVRLVQTLRGGDKPKGEEEEFEDVTVMPRSAWEPWGLFRKPIDCRTIASNLRKWGTGGLRRESKARPFTDVIQSGFPTKAEREISDHPSLKPQKFMRQLVRASLPLGKGIVLDPFMGSGSTMAAASVVGYEAIGLERDEVFFNQVDENIPKLAAIEDDLEVRRTFDEMMEKNQ